MVDDKQRREWRQMLDASTIAWIFPVAIAIGFLWGWGMDKLFGTKPWLTIIFSAFGVIAGFVQFFRLAMGKK